MAHDNRPIRNTIDWKHEITQRLANLKLGPTREAEIVEELSQHLEDRFGELVAGGATAEQASHAVLEELSAAQLLTRETRRVEPPNRGTVVLGSTGRGKVIGDLLQDLGYGLRLLRKDPFFSTVAVLTLALGVGVNAAVFSVINGVLLRPLPYPEPDRLVMLQNQFLRRNLMNAGVSAVDYADYRTQKDIFEEVAAGQATSFNLTGVDRPENVPGALVTASFFPVLRIEIVAGRAFGEDEDRPGFNQVAVISEGFWRRRFGGDPDVIGETLQLNDQSYTVVGVVGQTPEILGPGDVFLPAAFRPEQMNPAARGARSLFALARLQPGVSLEQAQTEMNALSQSLARQFPNQYPPESGWGIRVDSVTKLWVGNVQLALWVLMGAVGFVLLIACANVSNLLLTRATARSREIAIRTALGADTWRIARQLLTENVLLGLIGGATGIALAVLGIEFLIRFAPRNFPRLSEIGVNWQAIVFALGVSVLTALVAGLAPLLEATGSSFREALKEGSRRLGSVRQKRARSVIVVVEVALSLILMIGAGLLLQSFVLIQKVDPGFEPENVFTFRVPLSPKRYPEQAERVAFIDQLAERLSSLPGVSAVGATSMLPFIGVNSSGIFAIEGRDTATGSETPHGDIRRVSRGFFEAMGIPLLSGRLFTESDGAETPFVALVDEKLAGLYWPGEDPVGQRVRAGGPSSPSYAIVGVVGHVKHSQLDGESKGALYFLYSQNRAYMITFVMRTAGPSESLAAIAQREVSAIDKEVPIFEAKTMAERLMDTLTAKRAAAYLTTFFSVLALLLATIGVYGVLSTSVSLRTSEIGLRIALGAQAADVLKLVIGQGLGLVLVGLAAGLAGALAVTRLLSNLLFEVSATDSTTFASLPVLFIAVALLACYIPARRAARVDPMIALRHE